MKQKQLYIVRHENVIVMIADEGTINYCLNADVTDSVIEWEGKDWAVVIEPWKREEG